MKRPQAPKIIVAPDGDVLDQYALVQFVYMTSIAECEGEPVDINVLGLVYMTKAFTQTSSVRNKTK